MIRFRVIGISRDRRTPALKQYGDWLDQAFQAVHDQRRQDERDERIETIWRNRVRDNVLGLYRARDDHEPSMFMRRQAG